MDLIIEEEKPPPYVQYHCRDASLTLVDADQTPSQAPQKRKRGCWCTAMKSLEIAVVLCLMTTVAAVTLFFLQRAELLPKAEPSTTTATVGVTNLNLLAADNRFITITWDRPKGNFDFYLLGVTVVSGNGTGAVRKDHSGSCANGTIIRAEETQITCGPFEACSIVSVTVRTFSKGPPEYTSIGATLKDVFIAGEDPSEPRRLATVAETPHTTRFLWEPPTSLDGTLDEYNVKVCKKLTTCDENENLPGCSEQEVSNAWVDFNSTEDTSYCVFVSASARCGGNVLTGPPAAQEVRTPLFELPDVSNLALVGVKSGYITLSWQPPKGRFDYYSVEVSEDEASGKSAVHQWRHLCSNGTIIRPDQTEVTCGPFKPCAILSGTVRTHFNGPPEHSSPGVTVKNIFIPAEDPNPPTNVTMFPESPLQTRLHWSRPEEGYGTIESYSVKMCKIFRSCDPAEKVSDCAEHVTTETWTVFDSKIDTSYCVLIAAKIRCGMDEISSRQVAAEIRTPLFDLPDVTNFRLLSAVDNSVTVAWKKPDARFDHYWLSIHKEGIQHGDDEKMVVGLCENGTILHRDQTQVTCTNLKTCSSVDITLATHRNGPPEHTSRGVRLQGIFIPGEEPDPPKNINIVGKSSSLARLQWEPPAKISGKFLAYTVNICTTFESCGGEVDVSNCTQLQTYETWLNYRSNVDTKYCVMVVTSSQCGEHVLNSRPAVAEIQAPLLALPDVTNLNVVAADNHYVTVAWDRPRFSFDFYWLDVTGGYENGNVSLPMRTASACGNGTIIHPQQTQITCGPFDSCSSVDVTVRTYTKGPPELMSTGTTLSDIFINGQDPSEPRSIKMLAKSPTMTRLEWQAPTSLRGIRDGYRVKVCEGFISCDENHNSSDCAEYETSDKWLDVNSTADTPYCILITASARCGRNVLTSLPATLEIRTPLFELPDVSNLALVGVKSGYVTLSWQPPKGRFDYYSVDVTEVEANGTSAVHQWRHLCSNGTIIRPDQTEVTCGPFEPCAILSGTMRTHFNGPPEHSSPGVTVKDIFIPAEDPIPAMNVTMIPETPSQTRLHWGRPEKEFGSIETYSVNICSAYVSCDPAERMSHCAEYVTTEMWTVFDSNVDTSYCVLITANIRCGMNEISSRQIAAEIRTPLFDLPDVTNLRVLYVVDSAVTIAWKKPEARFDYYWVFIAVEEDDQDGYDEMGIVGSCGNGTIIHADQTQVTCTHLKPCSKVNITLRAHRNGPPERTSRGVCLQDIFVTGEEPHPPKNITVVGRSPSLTRLHWEPSGKVTGRFLGYTVKIYTTFKACAREADMSGCAEVQAYDSWLDFRSRVDTKYCVVVSASSQCGDHVLNGRPAAAEITTPLLELPDVLNLTVGVEDGYITFSWQRPQGRFDYYFVEVVEEGSRISSQHKLGLCANGTIIHPDQTQLVCGPFEPCTKLSYTMRTRLNGPQERSSPGVTVKDIFVPAEDPHPPRNITMTPTSPSRTHLHWHHPDKANAVIDSYSVKICRTIRTCGQAEYLADCIEHVTSGTSITFNSTADTAYCVLVTAETRCALEEISSRAAVAEIRTPIFELADVSRLMTAGINNGFITLSWQRPHGRFDYYSIETIEDQVGSKNNDNHVLGLCANGTIIRPEQTQVTCGPFKPCTKLSCTVRTHLNGPPERRSSGATVRDILIPAQEPLSPRNVRMVPQSPSLTQLHWDYPGSVSAAVASYIVKICRTFRACGPAENLTDCEEQLTSQAWVTFHSTADTPYCILVTAKRTCGIEEIEGQPAVSELRTPLFELPDVSNLAVHVENGYITLTWQRPQIRFDYYSVEAFGNDVGSKKIEKHKVGLCTNGTIIHRDQTQVTCGPFEPCTKLSCTVRTHLNGQRERISSGVTAKDIFIPAEELHPPRNISMVAESPSLTRLHWEHVNKVAAAIESYNVRICRTFKTCVQGENMGGCKEHMTAQTSVTFESTVDTSYCILVTAKTRCGIDEIKSLPAVANLRTPIFVPPDVTNLHVVTVGADFFTAAWERPKVNFDYYWISVTGASNNSTGSTQGVAGSCVNGTIIHPDQTQVTCRHLQPCVNVTFKVRTHINKPHARTSPGVTLTDFFIPGNVGVRNLTLSAVGDDNFTLTWQKTEGCAEYYSVKVTDNSDGSSGSASNGIVSCNKGAVVTSNQTSVTCDQPLTCANATISVKPHVKGLPADTLSGDTLTGVYLFGKTPPAVTDLKLVKITHTYFKVTYKTPKKCYAGFHHSIRPANNRARARIGRCRVDKAISRITAACNIAACGKVNIGVQTTGIGPSGRVSTSARLMGIDTKRKC